MSKKIRLKLPDIMLIQLFFVLGMVFAIPLFGIIAVFFILPAMVIAGKKYTPYVPYAMFFIQSLLTFFLNHNIIVVYMFPIVSAVYLALWLSLKQKSYIRSIASVLAVSMLSLLSCFLVAGLYYSTFDPKVLLKDYIENASNDIIIVSLARYGLEASLKSQESEQNNSANSIPSDNPNLDLSTDAGKYDGINFDNVYPSKEPTADTKLALEHFYSVLESEIDRYSAEYLLVYATALGILSFLFCYLSLPLNINEELLSGKEQQYKYFPETIKRYATVKKDAYRQPFSLMTVPKEYFVAVFIPLTGFMWLFMNTDLGEIFGMVWSALCVLPYAFSGLAITFYFLDYIDNPVPVLLTKIFAGAVFAVSIVQPFVLIVFSLFGVADCIIHTRRLLEKVLME